MNDQRGFTLPEILVVTSIIVMMSMFMATNFSRLRIDLNQSRLVVIDGIREAQSLALAGAAYEGAHRCGYGIHFTASGFTVYAGPDSSVVDCATEDKSYANAGASTVRTSVFSNSAVEIALPVADIFFEPPNPTTYMCTSPSVCTSTNAFADVIIRRTGVAPCTIEDCKTINVTTAGRITAQ
jgi:prepilin-type N-terminal cleavage/methylation domain-containing protein